VSSGLPLVALALGTSPSGRLLRERVFERSLPIGLHILEKLPVERGPGLAVPVTASGPPPTQPRGHGSPQERSAVSPSTSAKMCAMKRSHRWSVNGEDGSGNRMSPAGTFRRRRALRHVDILAQHPAPELAPAVAHVRVIGGSDGDDTTNQPGAAIPTQGEVGTSSIPALSVPTPSGGDARIVGDQPGRQLHAVPIDEPLRTSH
jgi:hypothetical protein